MNYRITALTVLACFISCAATFAADLDWPQWRGPDRTDTSPATGLLKEWPAGGPELLWTFENAGVGYSSYSIVDGKLYTMGAFDETEYLICLDAVKGEELWKTEVGPRLKNGFGDGPRSTPTVDGEYVYGLSGKGNVFCLSRDSGDVVWSLDVKKLGGKEPNWGYTESVLIDGEKLLCTTGGNQGTVVALNKTTGDVIWHSLVMNSSGESAKVQYASIMPAVINGDRQYVQLTMNTLFGLRAADGKVLWQAEWPPGKTAVIPTPLVKDNYVYITSGYGAGCKLVKVNPDYSVDEVYFNKLMKNHHGGVLLLDDTVYGHADAGWLAQDFLTGEEVWRERGKLGKGCVTYADGMLYCVDEQTHEVALIEATRQGYIEHGRFTLPQQSDKSWQGRCWTHPVVIDGRLFLRDEEYIFCYDVSAK